MCEQEWKKGQAEAEKIRKEKPNKSNSTGYNVAKNS